MWVMMWAMMWVTGMMAATTPAKMPEKGMAGMPAGRGGGLLVEDAAAAAAAVVAAAATVGGDGCILQGLFAFFCEDIFVWYFYDVWGELARSHLPSHSRHA